MVFAHRRPDQYYWVTTLLSSRFGEGACTSAIAVLIGALAVLPVAAVFTPVGPHSVIGIALTGVIAVFLTAMTLMWARRRWPTRRMSKFFVTGMVIAAAAEPLLLTEPIVALVATLTFTVVGLYSAIFHRPGYVVIGVVAAAATAGTLAAPLTDRLGVLSTVALVVLVVIFTGIVPLVCWVALQLPGIELLRRDVDAFTGLLTPAAFNRRVAELVAARNRRDDRYLVVTAVLLDDLALLAAADGHVPRERAQVALADALRRATRSGVVITHADSNLFVLAELFTTTDLSPYAERIHSALTSTPPRMNVSIGIVHTVRTQLVNHPTEQLVEYLIAQAVDEARRHVPGETPPRLAVDVTARHWSRDAVDDGG